MESLRLDRTTSCPSCYFAIKPFVVSVTGKGNDRILELQCPIGTCGHQFKIPFTWEEAQHVRFTGDPPD